jgi:hypothetical protein
MEIVKERSYLALDAAKAGHENLYPHRSFLMGTTNETQEKSAPEKN